MFLPTRSGTSRPPLGGRGRTTRTSALSPETVLQSEWHAQDVVLQGTGTRLGVLGSMSMGKPEPQKWWETKYMLGSQGTPVPSEQRPAAILVEEGGVGGQAAAP